MYEAQGAQATTGEVMLWTLAGLRQPEPSQYTGISDIYGELFKLVGKTISLDTEESVAISA